MSSLFWNPGLQGEGGGAESIIHYQIHSNAPHVSFLFRNPGIHDEGKGELGGIFHYQLHITSEHVSSLPGPRCSRGGRGELRASFITNYIPSYLNVSFLFCNPGVQGEGGGSWEHHSLPNTFHRIWKCRFSSETRVFKIKRREGGAEIIIHYLYQLQPIASEWVFSVLKPGSTRGGRGELRAFSSGTRGPNRVMRVVGEAQTFVSVFLKIINSLRGSV